MLLVDLLVSSIHVEIGSENARVDPGSNTRNRVELLKAQRCGGMIKLRETVLKITDQAFLQISLPRMTMTLVATRS